MYINHCSEYIHCIYTALPLVTNYLNYQINYSSVYPPCIYFPTIIHLVVPVNHHDTPNALILILAIVNPLPCLIYKLSFIKELHLQF